MPTTRQQTIISYGYFPRELPPPFNTTSFAKAVPGLMAHLKYAINAAKPHLLASPYISVPTVHNIARRGTLRRKISTPNPINYFQLALAVHQYWKQLIPQAQSKFALSSPTWTRRGGRAFGTKRPYSEKENFRVLTRIGKRWLLKADIQSFYESIYTHSIAWALHTKPVAKANHSLHLLGNLLDALVRSGQDRQSVGIPIGPDLSHVIAEIIFSRIDADMGARFPSFEGFRYLDDIELTFSSLEQAQQALGKLQVLLSEYHLKLNPWKTAIEELPAPIEKKWVAPLRDRKIRDSGEGQRTDIFTLFDTAFELRNQSPDEAVLRYAIARMRSTFVATRHWKLYLGLLLQCVRVEPGTLPSVVDELATYKALGFALPKWMIRDVLETAIREHAPIGHGSEVAWAIWGSMLLDIKISQPSATAIRDMQDNFVALMALDAKALGVYPKNSSTKAWADTMRTDSLNDENWLLAYEANVKNWLPSVGQHNHVGQHQLFSHLKAAGVTFYRKNAIQHANLLYQVKARLRKSAVTSAEEEYEEPDEELS